MNSEFALFDFCGTIVNYQSFNPYIIAVLKSEKEWAYSLYSNRIFSFVSKVITKIINKINKNYYFDKHLLVFLTKGISLSAFEKIAEEYFKDVVSKRYITETLELIKKCKRSGMKIAVVSAGCDLYISLFAKEHDVDLVLTNRIRFKDGMSTGCLNNKDLLGTQKVLEINKAFITNDHNASFEIGVSDSFSDIPMLNICNKKIVISHCKHQNWVTSEYEEIIYE